MNIFISATRVVNAVGKTYQNPANLIDGNPTTTADIYLTGAFQADWFILDMGATVAVGSVTLQNVTASVNPLAIWVSPDAGQSPDPANSNVSQLSPPATNPAAAGTDYVFTAAAGTPPTGRYLLVRQAFISSSNSSAVIGGATYAPAQNAPRSLTMTVSYV